MWRRMMWHPLEEAFIFKANKERLEFGMFLLFFVEKTSFRHTLPISLAKQYRDEGREPTDKEIEETIAKGKNPVILYAHGNSFDRTINHRCMLYNVLNDMDYHVIAFDYRGRCSWDY